MNARCMCGRVYLYVVGADHGCSAQCRYDWEAAQVVTCGAPFTRLADGEPARCVLPAGHVTKSGEPSAHAWGVKS